MKEQVLRNYNALLELGILKAIGTAKTEFTEGVLKRAVFDLQYGHGKARKDVFKVSTRPRFGGD